MSKGKEESFGETIQELRRDKNWTIKEFIKRLETKGDRKISPAYITRIEQYGEIPSPEVICLMADVLKFDLEKLLECAKRIKVRKFDKNLEEKYQKAVGLHRIQRKEK